MMKGVIPEFMFVLGGLEIIGGLVVGRKEKKKKKKKQDDMHISKSRVVVNVVFVVASPVSSACITDQAVKQLNWFHSHGHFHLLLPIKP